MTLSKPAGVLIMAAMVLAVTAAVLAGSQARSAAPAAAPRPSMTITTATVGSAAWPAVVEASGGVAAWQEASVGARLSGLPLAEVRVNVGDAVRKGQLLARFDDATVRAEVAQAEASLAQAEASARQADANRDRALKLKNSGAMSEQEILQNTTQSATAQAQVAVSKAALTAARLKLDYTRVLAPDDGVISARGATLGAVAQPGTELFRLIRQGRLEWRAELTAAQLLQVKPGLAVQLSLPDGGSASGRVRQLAPALDNATRLGIAYVDLAPGSRARAAMYTSGRIVTTSRAALTVPGEAVVIRDGRSYVFRLDGDRVRMTPVVTGRREGTQVELVQGASAGQVVALRGAGFLNDNDLVRTQP
jgi:RND family efflux transporter MFP subunit